jgi:lipopolysaccharide transport system permease protein
MNERQVHIIDADKQRLFNWKELWQYRELFYFFSWRDVKIRYKQTVLGFLWVILQPLIMMIIFTVFFGRALKVPSQNLPYPVFVFSGLLIWNVFSTGLASASNSMISNSSIIKKIYFPRLIIPVSSILVAVLDFFIAFALFVGMLLILGQSVSLSAVWCWPMSLLLVVIATLGPGSWLAALNAKYRDFRYVIPFLTQVLFFTTPVLYPVSVLHYPVVRYLLAASPLYAAIELFRAPIIGSQPDVTLMAISLISCASILIIGLLYFKRTEDFFADLV